MRNLFVALFMFLGLISVNAQIKDPIGIKLSCAPLDYNPKILSSPNPKSIHPWQKSGGEVGESCSFFSSKKIENENGIFLFGDLISPRGGVITKGCYIIYSEWECSKY